MISMKLLVHVHDKKIVQEHQQRSFTQFFLAFLMTYFTFCIISGFKLVWKQENPLQEKYRQGPGGGKSLRS